MRETLKILKQLILKGVINDRDDRELFEYASMYEIWDELETASQEWDFHIVKSPHNLYLIPTQENTLFNTKLRDVKENVGSEARNIDAYLQCYIVIVVLHMLFGSKNSSPQSADFLLIKDVVAELDERFENENEATALEATYHINFRKISDIWNSKSVVSEGRKDSKFELVRTACRFLRNQKLLKFCDDDDDKVEPLERFVAIMSQYYLNESRICEINALFDKKEEN